MLTRTCVHQCQWARLLHRHVHQCQRLDFYLCTPVSATSTSTYVHQCQRPRLTSTYYGYQRLRATRFDSHAAILTLELVLERTFCVRWGWGWCACVSVEFFVVPPSSSEDRRLDCELRSVKLTGLAYSATCPMSHQACPRTSGNWVWRVLNVQFGVALRPQRLYGLLGTGVQDGILHFQVQNSHLHFHTAPELCAAVSFNAAWRPQRLYGLLGTGSPGQSPRLSHSSWALYLRMYLWWSLRTWYLLACQVRVTVGASGLCCCVCVTSFER